MSIEEPNFDHKDLLAATNLTARAVQMWATQGVLSLGAEQQNPGPGKKRLYSTLDIARIATIKSLVGQGLQASAAGQIAFRLERGDQSAAPWRKALQEKSNGICIIVTDNFHVPIVLIGDDRKRAPEMLEHLNEVSLAGPSGEGAPLQIKAEAFEIGPAVSFALNRLVHHGQR